MQEPFVVKTMENSQPKDGGFFLCPQRKSTVILLVTWAALAVTLNLSFLPSASNTFDTRYLFNGVPRIKVFSAFVDNPVAQKERRALAKHDAVEHVVMTTAQMQEFLMTEPCGEGVLERFNDLLFVGRRLLAQEVWKYCSLSVYGGMYLDAETPMIPAVEDLLNSHHNMAVLSDSVSPNTLHGSFFLIRESHSIITIEMLRLLMTTPEEELDDLPLNLAKTLYRLVKEQVPSSPTLTPGQNGDSWYLLNQECSTDAHCTANPADRLRIKPLKNGYCCNTYDEEDDQLILMTDHPMLPYTLSSRAEISQPYNAEPGMIDEENELPYIATISEEIKPKLGDIPSNMPNLFEILRARDCLPNRWPCIRCLVQPNGATCETCASKCACYCNALCTEPVQEKFHSKDIIVKPPAYKKDPQRLIPRIIHQTWSEPVDQKKYPNMSRLVESFKQSGWEYRFYTDDMSVEFLSTHFPPEVLEAYDMLRPGAFKADLFRYCVLLIHGGLYADVDILLESNLDQTIPPDVGFMVPFDQPGVHSGHRMCLWNGLIAAAPGHPFLAKVIERVVNTVRNRYTAVDMDRLFCPNPELSVLHSFDMLFTAGPCILGAMVNEVLGRPGQTHYHGGELPQVAGAPGRSIILHQSKSDMGAHRFTLLEQNIVIAATDFPGDDRKRQPDSGTPHYSALHVRERGYTYGSRNLYVEKPKANEDVRFIVR